MTVKVVKTIASEFRLSHCKCHHEAPQEFLKSQWQNTTKSTLFFLYRLFVAVFFTTSVLYSMISHGIKNGPDKMGYFFIALTNWGIVLCMVCAIYGFILVSVWYYHPEYSQKLDNQEEMPGSFKFYWALHNTSLIMSLLITILYWAVVYDKEKDNVNAQNILTHVTNSIVMFIDLIIVAHPVRLLHCIHAITFGVTYGVFSYVYYVLGGTTLAGNRYIYKILNWEKPRAALTVVAGVLCFGLVMHFLLFLIYRLRVFICHRLFFKNTFKLDTTSAGVESASVGAGYNNAAFTIS